jgi:hypothetical protein
VYALLSRDGQVTVALRGRRTSRCWFDVGMSYLLQSMVCLMQ